MPIEGTLFFLSHRSGKIQRVHRAPVLAHFEMHMGTGAVAAAAGVADHISPTDGLPRLYGDGAQVVIPLP